MKPAPVFALFALPILVWTAPFMAQDGPQGCVTQTLSLLVYIDDNRGSATNINRNILPPPPTAGPPGGTGPLEPAPTPLPSPAPVVCPTLYLNASDMRAQTACKMASDLPGARCRRLWSGMTLVIEPFD